jgi:hypothetical protein
MAKGYQVAVRLLDSTWFISVLSVSSVVKQAFPCCLARTAISA